MGDYRFLEDAISFSELLGGMLARGVNINEAFQLR